MPPDRIRIGCGAGFADDRIPPGVEIVERDELDYLAMECLAERTIARETLDRAKEPPRWATHRCWWNAWKRSCRLPCKLGVKIVANLGAANPMSAARVVRKHTAEWNCPDYTCTVVTGNEVTEVMRAYPELPLMEDGAPFKSLLPRMASANAYLGADGVARGFATGADVVITGRVADPALFLAPMLHAFGWSYDDYAKLASGTLAGRLLECSGQLTGGCFTDPGKKEVEDLAGLGYPLADVWSDGRVEVAKTPGSGGRLDVATCMEQPLYEMHDPTAYITPDCVLDASAVTFHPVAKDRVAPRGARGKPRTPTYKSVVGYFDG
jgi:Acyclic terpene utilisation family protein AtuA